MDGKAERCQICELESKMVDHDNCCRGVVTVRGTLAQPARLPPHTARHPRPRAITPDPAAAGLPAHSCPKHRPAIPTPLPPAPHPPRPPAVPASLADAASLPRAARRRGWLQRAWGRIPSHGLGSRAVRSPKTQSRPGQPARRRFI